MWIEASDGSVMKGEHVAGIIIREVEIPDRDHLYVVACLYPSGQFHHDIEAFKSREDAEREVKRLTRLIK